MTFHFYFLGKIGTRVTNGYWPFKLVAIQVINDNENYG